MAKRKGPTGRSDGELLAWAADVLGVTVHELVPKSLEVQRDIRFGVDRVTEAGDRMTDDYRLRLVAGHSAFWDEARPAATVQLWLHEDGVFNHRQRARTTLYEGEDGSLPHSDADPDLVASISEHRLRAIEEARESAAAEAVRSRLMESEWRDQRKRRTVWIVYDAAGEPSSPQALFTDRAAAEALAGPPLPEPVRSRGDDRIRVVEAGAWFGVIRGHKPNVLYVGDDFTQMCEWARTNIGEPTMERDWTGGSVEGEGRAVRIRRVSLFAGPAVSIP